MATISQRSFAGGVIAPNMYARYDDMKFQTGVAECRNFLCLPQGGAQNRTGLTYVAAARYPHLRTRLIAFNYSIDQTVVLEFGHHYVRFHTQGRTLMSNGQPYTVNTPYDANDLAELYVVQSSDVMTLTHQKYPPMELRRYGVLDWRLVTINFSAPLSAPGNVRATRTSAAYDDKNADKYTWRYRVTALNKDKTVESEPSAIASVVANLYQTGTVATIQWDAVPGATYYRVYKGQGGLFGYIGDTTELSITDENIGPETDKTPPIFDEVFKSSGGISRVDVTNGGSGYVSFDKGVSDLTFPAKVAECYKVNDSSEGAPFGSGYGKRLTEYENRPRFPTWSNRTENQNMPDYPPYPEYPSVDLVKRCLRVIDKAFAGSGATIEPILEYERRQSSVSMGGDAGDVYRYSYSIVTLTGVRFTNRGQGYMLPYLEVADLDEDRFSPPPARVFRFALNTQSDTVVLGVSGGNGTGAELRAVVENGQIKAVDIMRAGSGYVNPQVYIASSPSGSGATFSAQALASGEYPRCTSYFEQRRCFASTTQHPQHIWMTKSGTESNMTYSLPVQPDDRISVELASQENAPILHLVPLSRLVILTASSEWRTDTLNSDAVTPSSISVRRQSSVGASPVQPVVVNAAMLYCAGRGGHVREFTYSSDAGGYVTGDLSLRATHLFDGFSISELAFSKAPHPVLWCVSSDGRLLGLTYVPEQNVGAWHEHYTDGAFESICTVAEGKEDVLYAVVRRQIGGQVVRYIERLSEREKGIFVDSAGEYNGDATTTVHGLNWLEGRTVSILADGSVQPQQTVVNGTITLEQAARRVIVGLPYTSDLRTLPAVFMTRTGASAAQGACKNIKEVTLRVLDASGVWVGPDFEKLTEWKQRTTEPMGSPPDHYTGLVKVKPQAVWNDDGQICVRQADPLPITVLSISADVRVEGE